MKKLLLSTAILFAIAAQAQNVGVGTNDPKSKLDIAGGLSLREGTALTLTNGNNDNIALTGGYSFYRIIGPTGVFSLSGIVPTTGADGQMLTLVNTTTQVMTIKNNNSTTPAYSIKTLTGGDIASVAGGSSVTLQYNNTDKRWYVTGSQNFEVTAGSITTSDIVPGTNSAVTVTNGAGKAVGAGNVVLDITTNNLNQKGIVAAPTGGDDDRVWGTDAGGYPGWTKVGNAKLSNSSVTVTAGAGLTNGGPVSLGSAVTLDVAAGNGITVNANDIAVNYDNSTIGISGGKLAVIDLPANNGHYIWNGTGAQSGADFNIDGSGTIGGAINANGGVINGPGINGGSNGLLNIKSNTNVRIALDADANGSNQFEVTNNGGASPVFTVTEAGNVSANGSGTFTGDVTLSGNNRTLSSGDAFDIKGNSGIDVVIDADNTGTLSDFNIRKDGSNGDILFNVNESASPLIYPYGTGTGNTGGIRFRELATNGANYVGFAAPDAIGANVTWTLPSNTGGANTVLKNDGSGNLTWGADNTGTGTVTNVATGAGLTGGPITTSGTISIPNSGVTNAMLQNSGITVNTGTGLSGGGTLSLGGTLNLTNTAPDKTVTLNNGSGISVSGTYPNFTITNTSPSSGGTITGVTASNGLNSTGGTTPDIKLGGTLSANTEVALNSKNLSFSGTGNVGIGTNNPQAKLQIAGSAQSLKVGTSINAANANAEVLSSLATVGADANSVSSITAGAWNFYNAGNSPSWSGTIIKHYGTGVSGSSYGLPDANSGALVFQNVSNGIIATNGANIHISPLGNVSTTFLTNGNVGIGTTAPDQKLDVNGQLRITDGQRDEGLLLSAGGADGNAWSRIFMEENNADTYGFSIVYNGDAANTVLNYPTNLFGISRHNNDATGVIALAIKRDNGNVGIGTTNPGTTLAVAGALGVSETGGTGNRLQISSNGSGAVLFQNDNSDIIFKTLSGTQEKMRIKDNGNVELNRYVKAGGYTCRAGTSGAYSNIYNWYWTGSSLQAWVDVTNVGTLSDRRLKSDISPMSGTAIDRVMELKPVSFMYKKIEGTIFTGNPQLQEGFVADDLQEVIPSAVNGKKDALTSKGTIQPQTLNPVPIISVLTKAVQEQQKEIEYLKRKVEELQKKH